MILIETMAEFVAEINGATRARIRERARTIFFPGDQLDRQSYEYMQTLADFCDTGDPDLRLTGLRIIAELSRIVASDQVVVPEVDLVVAWTRRSRPIVVHHVIEADAEKIESAVTALYWLDLVEDGDWLELVEAISSGQPCPSGSAGDTSC